MIKIKAIIKDGEFFTERELTTAEQKTITSILNDGSDNTVIYFQGDEPKENPIIINEREVALWKVRAILKQMGLIPSIETALNSLPENIKDIALSAWEYSSTINQYSPTVKLIQQTCNLTDAQMEDVFDNAEKINI